MVSDSECNSSNVTYTKLYTIFGSHLINLKNVFPLYVSPFFYIFGTEKVPGSTEWKAIL